MEFPENISNEDKSDIMSYLGRIQKDMRDHKQKMELLDENIKLHRTLKNINSHSAGAIIGSAIWYNDWRIIGIIIGFISLIIILYYIDKWTTKSKYTCGEENIFRTFNGKNACRANKSLDVCLLKNRVKDEHGNFVCIDPTKTVPLSNR